MESHSGIRLRAYLLGVLLSVVVMFMAHYSANVVLGSYLSEDHMPAAGIFVFFVLVFLLNPVMGLIRRSFELNINELVAVYAMLLVTSSITTMGVGAQLFPFIAAPLYYATPENRWAELIHPHLRSWLHPRGEETVRHFFEGLPPGESIPWLAWLQPALVWFVMIFALYMMMLFLMVIMRKQWVEKEKLSFPLVQLPLEMIRDDEKKSLIKPLFRNKLFWLAAAIPFTITGINALHSYFHFIPEMQLTQSVQIFQRTTSLTFLISFPVMGFTYLIHQEVALGIWVFNLLYTVVRGFFNITGITSAEIVGGYGARGAIFRNFGAGTFFTFVFWGFWMARSHLKDVFGKAFGRRDADDSGEIVSYRTAAWGLIACTAVMLIWLVALGGMSFPVAFLFVVLMIVFLVGLTRIIAEAGISVLIAPSISSGQVISAIGSNAAGSENMVALSLTWVYHGQLRAFPMTAFAHGLKMGELIKRRRKSGMFAAMILAIFIAYFVSNWLMLRIAYTYGGMNLTPMYFSYGPQNPFVWAVSHIRNPIGPSVSGWVARGAGAAMMGALMFMRYRFLWWPFHHAGFAIGSISWIDRLWFSIFLIWLVKALILKYGGVRMFRLGRPFFLGLILGQYSAASVWFIIDLITGHTGNRVFWI